MKTLIALLVLGAAGCAGSQSTSTTPKPTPTPAAIPTATQAPARPVPPPSSGVDQTAIKASFAALTDAYNRRDYIEVARHLDSTLDSKCGGITQHLFAISQYHDAEKISYTVDDVVATSPLSKDGMVDVDVTFSSHQEANGSLVDDHLSLGLRAKQGSQGWVSANDFPWPNGPRQYCH